MLSGLAPGIMNSFTVCLLIPGGSVLHMLYSSYIVLYVSIWLLSDNLCLLNWVDKKREGTTQKRMQVS